MSGEIVNFNKARKAKIKAETSAKAASNRAAFGRPKAERANTKTLAEKAARILDGHKRTPNDKA